MAHHHRATAGPARGRRVLGPLLLVGWLGVASPSAAQIATASVEENFRADPNGIVVATLLPGVVLDVLGRRDRWVEARLEGWIWSASLQGTDRDDFEVLVSAADGENLRAEPQGTVLARLSRGTLLEEVERRPGWIRVRRAGWVWGPSVRVEGGAAGAPASGAPAAPVPAAELARAPGAGLAVLSAPDGDTLARTAPGADLQVTGREGNWVRVRVEGWAWLPEATLTEADTSGPDEAVPATPSAVSAAPARWRGRLVTWDLQYISLERAEKVRTDFFEGEPFLLMRPFGGQGPFVYVAVPPDRMVEVQGLTPLERISVTGRVRTGASELTGSPILDLVQLQRGGRR